MYSCHHECHIIENLVTIIPIGNGTYNNNSNQMKDVTMDSIN